MNKKPQNIKKSDWEAVDSPPLSEEQLSNLRPVKETHPDIPKRVRGPQKKPVKAPISIRLESKVVDYFKSQGPGWQTRINDVLAGYVKSKTKKSES